MNNSVKKNINTTYYFLGVILAFIVNVTLRYMAPINVNEYSYRVLSGFYVVLRNIYDYTLGHLPFASIYLIFPIVLILSYLYIKKPSSYFKSKGVDSLRKIANIVALFYSFFYIFWGWQYMMPSIDQRMHLPKKEISFEYLMDEFKTVCLDVSALRYKISNDTTAVSLSLQSVEVENSVRNFYKKFFAGIGTKISSPVRVRELYPKGSLLLLSTAGVYIPFSFEGHIDPGIHNIQKPFTLAHEMAHGFGITDEGECNFIAYLACENHENPEVRYSGTLAYWRYLRGVCWNNDSTLTKSILTQNLSTAVRNDLKAIRKNNEQYPSIADGLRDVVYNYFLESNGVEGGMNSYYKIVDWVARWKSHNVK